MKKIELNELEIMILKNLLGEYLPMIESNELNDSIAYSICSDLFNKLCDEKEVEGE